MTAPIDNGTKAAKAIVIVNQFLGMSLGNRIDFISRPDTRLKVVEGITKAAIARVIVS